MATKLVPLFSKISSPPNTDTTTLNYTENRSKKSYRRVIQTPNSAFQKPVLRPAADICSREWLELSRPTPPPSAGWTTAKKLYLCDSFAKLIYRNHVSLVIETTFSDLGVSHVYHRFVPAVARNVRMVIFPQLKFFIAPVLSFPFFHFAFELAKRYLCWFETHIPWNFGP